MAMTKKRRTRLKHDVDCRRYIDRFLLFLIVIDDNREVFHGDQY